jgi:cellulose synthase/poly-beta-1,6-N-acetylglucosamine synthase-like glycosyltransferase
VIGRTDTDTLTVIVPSYRRISALDDCLTGLQAQTRRPDQVIVAVHVSDEPTYLRVRELQAGWPELVPVWTQRPGVVAAQNQALVRATGAIVAFCDDDAVPYPDWAQRLLIKFSTDPRIAAVGGRDVIHRPGVGIYGANPVTGWRRLLGPPPVGRVQWWGRMTGNHHRADARACDTDVLKGVNMAFRRSEVIEQGFDDRLEGEGAVIHHELSICLPLRKRGLRVVYDPAILVAHYPAPRGPGDERNGVRPKTVTIASHNETLPILDYLPPLRRAVFIAWTITVGTGSAPGLVVLIRDLAVRRGAAWSRFRAAQRGRRRAWRAYRRRRRRPLAHLQRTSTGPLTDDEARSASA